MCAPSFPFGSAAFATTPHPHTVTGILPLPQPTEAKPQRNPRKSQKIPSAWQQASKRLRRSVGCIRNSSRRVRMKYQNPPPLPHPPRQQKNHEPTCCWMGRGGQKHPKKATQPCPLCVSRPRMLAGTVRQIRPKSLDRRAAKRRKRQKKTLTTTGWRPT